MLQKAKKYEKITNSLLCIYAFFSAISIGVSQTCTISYTVISILFIILKKQEFGIPNIKSFLDYSHKTRDLLAVLCLWLLTAIISAIYGTDPYEALDETFKTAIYLLFPISIFINLNFIYPKNSNKKVYKYLLCLFSGQVVASLHTIISSNIEKEVVKGIVGPVTESGQIVLVLPLSICFLYLAIKELSKTSLHMKHLISFITLSLSTICIGWSQNLAQTLKMPLEAVTLASCIFASISLILLLRENKIGKHLIITSLIFVALVLNLKRGPWLAVFIEACILGFFLSKRLSIFAFSSVIVIISLFSPVRERITNFSEHFSIEGGRKDMWSIGTEIAKNHPLGLGLDNAKYMQTIDPSLPHSHSHMHNNFLNLIVETGWLGALFFFVALFLLLKISIQSFRSSQDRFIRYTQLGLFTALIGWQIAGLVEYNFGDSEVRLIAFFFLGLILALNKPSTES